METIENTKELVLQKDALKIYLDSLLNCSNTSLTSDHEEIIMQVSPSEALFLDVFSEIKNTEFHIKTPRWATEYFSCLPVTVAGITLFLPLRQVRTVLPFSRQYDPIEGMPEWILGRLSDSKRSVKVVDLQKIVSQKMTDLDRLSVPSQLVIIGDGCWGLVCDEVEKVQQLNNVDVQWRAKHTQRRWIAGASHKFRTLIVDIRRIEFAMALESPLV